MLRPLPLSNEHDFTYSKEQNYSYTKFYIDETKERVEGSRTPLLFERKLHDASFWSPGERLTEGRGERGYRDIIRGV